MLLASCSEYGFHSPVTEVRQPAGPTWRLQDCCWDPPTPESAECDGVPVASAGPAPSDTCDAVEFEGWEMAIEWEVPTPIYVLPMVVPCPIPRTQPAGPPFIPTSGSASCPA